MITVEYVPEGASINACLNWTYRGENTTVKDPFQNHEYACRYAINTGRSHLERQVDYYITEARRLMENIHPFKQDKAAVLALARAYDFKRWMFDGWVHDTYQLANTAKKMHAKLKMILPDPANEKLAGQLFLLDGILQTSEFLITEMNRLYELLR